MCKTVIYITVDGRAPSACSSLETMTREGNGRSAELVEQLVAIWERSVRATHTFLSEAEVAEIKPFVPQALTGVAELVVAEKGGAPVGFMGVQDGRLEMLIRVWSLHLHGYLVYRARGKLAHRKLLLNRDLPFYRLKRAI